MDTQKKTTWAIEYVADGKRELHLHPLKHSTPEEAKDAFAEKMGIPWKELERRGAKVVQRDSTEDPRS